jgi:drug/metabolite transporter (DMT)-like permease
MLHTSGRLPSVSRQEISLLLVTVVWGATFTIVHVAVQESGPWFFVGTRYLIAGVISVLVFGRGLGRISRAEVVAGSAIGTMIFLGYGLQAVGLQTIGGGTSAFITALYVPLVPVLQWVVFRKRPQLLTWVSVALAFGGLVLIADPARAGVTIGPGELATLVSALPIAVNIILIGWFAGKLDLGRVTVVQLLVAGTLGLATMPVVGERPPDFSWVWLSAAAALGAASCVIQLTMNWAQRWVSPTRATIIYAGEPVWAAVIGVAAGERLPAITILGAVFILASSLLSVSRAG